MESSYLSSAFGGGIGERGREHENVHGANETIATFSVCPKVEIGFLGGSAKNALHNSIEQSVKESGCQT